MLAGLAGRCHAVTSQHSECQPSFTGIQTLAGARMVIPQIPFVAKITLTVFVSDPASQPRPAEVLDAERLIRRIQNVSRLRFANSRGPI